MRIIRFLDADDAVHWGLEAEDGQASVLTGDLFAELAPTGEQVAVNSRIRPRAARAARRLCQAHARGLRAGRPDPAASLLPPRPRS